MPNLNRWTRETMGARYERANMARLQQSLEILSEPVPLWCFLAAIAAAFGACFQLVGARHELSEVRDASVSFRLIEEE